MARRIAYQFFERVVLLLVLYGCIALAAAFNLISPSPPIWVNALADAWLQWAVLGGLLGGGIYAAASAQADNQLPHEALLVWSLRLWTALILLALVSPLLNLVPWLHLAQLAMSALTAISIARAGEQTRVTRIWLLGMIVSMASLWVGWTTTYWLPAVALGYWLIRRFSLVPQVWADTSLYTVSGLLTVAAALQIFLPALPVNGLSLIGVAGAVVSSIFYLVYAAHSYKPLSTRNATHTLAAHWYALAVLLILFGATFLGAVLAVPDVHRWTNGTDLTTARQTFAALALVAVVLGTINQAGAELRGHNWRITGLMPFWLIAFGSVGSGLLLCMTGVVQVYLVRMLSFEPIEVQALLQPLYGLRLIFVVALLLGFIIYALGFRARRPIVETQQT